MMKPSLSRAALSGLRAGKNARITASGPHECVALSESQFRGALNYVAQAAISGVKVPKEFFPEERSIKVLNEEEMKLAMMAAYAHFKSDANLALSFFYRYRGLGRLAMFEALRPWISFDPERDHYACFHPALLQVVAKMQMDRAGHFNADAVLIAVSALSPGFPDFQPPPPPQGALAVAANQPIERHVAA